MSWSALRVLALYERLGRENRLLLELLREGFTLAEAEERLAERMKDEGGRMNGPQPWPFSQPWEEGEDYPPSFGPQPPSAAEDHPCRNARRVVI